MDTLLQMENIVKDFPGVRAVNNVSFELREGEIHALLGHNGAGKTTLVKILAGAHKKDSGEIKLSGETVEFSNPSDAIKSGIHMVYQELDLIPYLSGAENIYLGQKRFHNKVGLINYKERLKAAQELIEDFDVDIDLSLPVRNLGISKQQIISIAKAISSEAKIIIFDEPTSALNDVETEKLFEIMRKLAEQGVTLIQITHRLSEVFIVANRVTVMREGRRIFTKTIEKVNKEEIIANMTEGKVNIRNSHRSNTNSSEIILKCENLSDFQTFKDISFELHRGEVLGLTGLIGCGAVEVARSIYGASKRYKGHVYVKGKELVEHNPHKAKNCGLAFVSDDRKKDGLVLLESVKNNITLTILHLLSKLGFIKEKEEREVVSSIIDRLAIRISDIHQEVKTLSGGNQQKVVLSKWLVRDSDIFILCEPTRGIDVSTKTEIHNMIRKFAEDEKGVIVVSSEIDEILKTCDRVLVLFEGDIYGEVNYCEFDRDKILNWMYGEN